MVTLKSGFKILVWGLIIIPIIFSMAFADEGNPGENKLKVCADPYMLPFSNKDSEGFENKIAELFAEKMGMELEYMWFPQRIGFIRNTLRAESEEGLGYKCDLVINVPSNFELAATTKPYYSSVYMLVYAKGRGLDEVTSPELLKEVVKNGAKVRFGVTDRGPGQMWVFRNDLLGSMVPYQGQPGDPKVHPGHTLIKDIVDNKIDAAVIWGPTAGYYAKKYRDKAELVLLPLKDDEEYAEARYTYSMAMAVRYGEKEWKDKVNQLIDENRDEILKILNDYGIPLVETKIVQQEEDDD